jgi:tRNA(Ile2) C34 agmatinyltransferase TiaS
MIRRKSTKRWAIIMPKKDTLCPLCGNHIVWTPELMKALSAGDFKCPRCNRKINLRQKDLA